MFTSGSILPSNIIAVLPQLGLLTTPWRWDAEVLYHEGEYSSRWAAVCRPSPD